MYERGKRLCKYTKYSVPVPQGLDVLGVTAMFTEGQTSNCLFTAMLISGSVVGMEGFQFLCFSFVEGWRTVGARGLWCFGGHGP